MSDLAELERRIAKLEDERDVLHRLYAYGHAIDYGNEAAWVDCFTADGVFDIRSGVAGRPRQVVSGHDELRDFAAGHTRAPELWHKHMLVEPVIALDVDTATSDAYFVVLMEHEELPLVRVFG